MNRQARVYIEQFGAVAHHLLHCYEDLLHLESPRNLSVLLIRIHHVIERFYHGREPLDMVPKVAHKSQE